MGAAQPFPGRFAACLWVTPRYEPQQGRGAGTREGQGPETIYV